jgi:hypothetical protein
MVMAPVPATLAMALPEMVPNAALDTTAALAGPPLAFPVTAVAK